jgi:hypothetical protein
MQEDNEQKEGMGQSWLEYMAAEPESVALWLDQARRSFLREGELCAATSASIFLVVVLAWAGLEEEIQMVIDELRHAVRSGGRPGEVVFALYYLTNAVARGEHPEEAAVEALIRVRRCERAMETNQVSGANEGAGLFERSRSMKTQQIVQGQEQELKAERVQEELMAMEEPLSSAFELTINQKQPVTIELLALQAVITLHAQ